MDYMKWSGVSAPSLPGSYSHLASVKTHDAFLKPLAGEHGSFLVSVDTSLDDLNAPFSHDHSEPVLEPLSLQLKIFKEVDGTKAFHPIKLKSSSGPARLSNPLIR